ncbi:MAG: DUF7910 domain-containing protein [Myxococcaceae bacterium]
MPTRTMVAACGRTLIALAMVSMSWGCAPIDTTVPDPVTSSGEDAGAEDGGAAADAGEAPDSGETPRPNAYAFVSQEIPTSVQAGQELPVKVTVRNTGTATWSLAAGYFLGSEHPRDNTLWGDNRVYMAATDSVPPGASYTFSRTVRAPDVGGTHPMQWQMLQDQVEWFGDATPLVNVLVECPATEVRLRADNGQYLSAEGGGGGAVKANRDVAQAFETFKLERCGGGSLQSGATVALKTSGGHFLTAEGAGGGALTASATTWGANQTFKVLLASGANGRIYRNSAIALQAANNQYLCAEGGGGAEVNANRAAIGAWETFKIELMGVPPPRTGLVTLNGTVLHDDGGDFSALGATLFSAPRWYKFDRPRLERALGFLQENGYDYIRVLGTVAWTGKEIDPHWPDYAAVIAGLTDLAYDGYGLRVQWTVFGDAQLIAPSPAERQAVVAAMLQMSQGREHKIILFETANEYWQNGFGGSGVSELRSLTQQMKNNTSILVAASAPNGWEDQVTVYSGGIADVMTLHHDRSVFGPDGSWRPVRQPWEGVNPAAGSYVASNNEPIGPGSSVNDEKDPLKLVMAAVTTFITNSPFYVFHSAAGVGGSGGHFGLSGSQDISEMPGAGSYLPMKGYLPADMANWTRQNHHWSGHPLRVYGDGTLNHMTTDGATNGCMRAYAAVKGNQFVVGVIGIKGTVHLEAKAPMELDVIHPLTGAIVQHHDLAAGGGMDLSGLGAYVLKGHNK